MAEQSALSRLSTALEEAGEAERDSFDGEAEAENEYLRLYQIAWAHATEDQVASTTKAKHCDNDPEVSKARQEWNRAIAKRKRCHSKVNELEHRLMAAMSHQRFIREATGG